MIRVADCAVNREEETEGDEMGKMRSEERGSEGEIGMEKRERPRREHFRGRERDGTRRERGRRRLIVCLM